MSGSANTFAPSMQMQMASSAVSHASGPTMLAECKQAILQAGGTWPPDGTRTTSGRSASPATFTDTENSGFLDAISMASSPAELKRLCDERTNLESSRLLNLMSWPSITEANTFGWHRIKGLSHEDSIRVLRLRKERRDLLTFFDETAGQYLHPDFRAKYHVAYRRLTELQQELYELTELRQYQI